MTVVVALLAGALGAVLRYGATLAAARRPSRIPLAVLLVNVVGSAIGGTVLGLAQAGAIGADARLIVLSGLAGGLTTFSTLSVETVQLVLEGKWRTAVVSMVSNLTIGVGVATAAWAIARALA